MRQKKKSTYISIYISILSYIKNIHVLIFTELTISLLSQGCSVDLTSFNYEVVVNTMINICKAHQCRYHHSERSWSFHGSLECTLRIAFMENIGDDTIVW